MTYTGGPLNLLNGKMGISAPQNSVPVIKLIRTHKPKSKDELVELIKYHYENKCKCGIKSQGTIEDFGQNLYNAQIPFWSNNRYSLKECIQWEYDLFVVQSLKGGIIEKRALNDLKKILNGLQISEAEGYLDEELRIDIILYNSGKEIAGIQVKPITFNYMRSSVIIHSKKANLQWGKPVFYLYYDNDENFINFDKIVAEIEKL